MVRLNGRLSYSCRSSWSIDSPARQLDITLRLIENWPDVIDAYSRCAKFLENRVGAFGD
jgi:hypothetical protein